VTVLDAFSFKPDDKSHIPDERCHQLLAEILRAKKPKVVIRCHRGEYKDSWMKHFELPGEEYKFVRNRCMFRKSTQPYGRNPDAPGVSMIGGQ
jgi:hypothetical protein